MTARQREIQKRRRETKRRLGRIADRINMLVRDTSTVQRSMRIGEARANLGKALWHLKQAECVVTHAYGLTAHQVWLYS